MGKSAAKLVTVSSTGQISIGKAWAGCTVLVEPVGKRELRISEGMVIPKYQSDFYTQESMERLEDFNQWDSSQPKLHNIDTSDLRGEIEALRKNVKNKSTQHEFIKVSTDFPRIKLEMADLENTEFEQLLACIKKIQSMTWQQIYETSSKGANKRGLNWEPLEQKTKEGRSIASIRVSKKFRARVSRRNEFMIFISLHPDHDSAYNEDGGELV